MHAQVLRPEFMARSPAPPIGIEPGTCSIRRVFQGHVAPSGITPLPHQWVNAMSISLEAAKQVLQAQPFSRLLGAELVRFSENMVELRIPIVEHLKQQYGFVHGGVISYAADNALTFAGGSALGPSVVTSEFKINYIRPALGDVLIARASVVHAGATQAVCRCDVISFGNGGEVLCAVAQGTIAAIDRRKGT